MTKTNEINLTNAEAKLLDQAEDGTLSGHSDKIRKLIDLGLAKHVSGTRESLPEVNTFGLDVNASSELVGETVVYKTDDKVELTEAGKVYNDALNVL